MGDSRGSTTFEDLGMQSMSGGAVTYAEPEGHLAETLIRLGIGVVGVGFIGAGLFCGWFVAGILAVKLGLLGFWWHLLSWAVVGGFITAPFLAIGRAILGLLSD